METTRFKIIKIIQSDRIDGFTIFEVTTVLALMSAIISLVAFSFNRFNQQLKLTQEINGELNHFRMIRSALWNDFTNSDSIEVQHETLTLYKGKNSISYKIIEEVLYRKKNGVFENLQIGASSIFQAVTTENTSYHIHFIWKGETIDWNCPKPSNLAIELNRIFDRMP